MALTPGAKTIDYPTTVSEVREGMTIRLPLFPAQMREVVRVQRLGATIFLHLPFGTVLGGYNGTEAITVVSDN